MVLINHQVALKDNTHSHLGKPDQLLQIKHPKEEQRTEESKSLSSEGENDCKYIKLIFFRIFIHSYRIFQFISISH